MADSFERLKTALSDRYAIERELGAGGMATVYLARDLKHQRQVAIKVLRPELAAALGPERFLREITTTAQLSHPHILPLHDSGEADGFLYYVMPYVEGESLRDRLEREKQLPIEDALQITREVATALSFAHSCDVVHRDIKPENILLAAGTAVVADFGIARAVAAAGGERLTETGMAIGTPAYMSPEQCEGASDIDGRTDIYALGSVLYELLAGEPPYMGPTAQAIIAKRLGEPVPRVSTLRETVPPTVEAAINRALAKAPADRYATAGQLVEALKVPTSTPTAVPTVPGSPARRLLVSTAVTILVLVGAWTILSDVILPSSSVEAEEPDAVLVLPFTLVGQEDDEFIAEGITEEVRSRLGKVAALKVLGRQTALRAREAAMTEQELGEEFDVDYVMDGTVRVQHLADGEIRLVVTPTLISTADGSQLWADTYDRSKNDMLAIQAEIAQSTVLALGAMIGGTEEQALAARPTENPEAWEQYLQGEAIFRVAWPSQPEILDAIEHYRQAITIDTTFVDAYAKLALASEGAYVTFDPSDERLAMAKAAAEQAVQLNADLPEAMLAMGFYHYVCCRDYDRALEYTLPVVERQPNDSFTVMALGAIRRRQGNFEEAARLFAQAADLDPFARSPAVQAVITYNRLREFDEVRRFADRWIAIRPRELGAHSSKVRTILLGSADVAAAWQVVQQVIDNMPGLSHGEFFAGLEALYGADFIPRILCAAKPCSGEIPPPSIDRSSSLQWGHYYLNNAAFFGRDEPIWTRSCLRRLSEHGVRAACCA